jgi:hypothetical protein
MCERWLTAIPAELTLILHSTGYHCLFVSPYSTYIATRTHTHIHTQTFTHTHRRTHKHTHTVIHTHTQLCLTQRSVQISFIIVYWHYSGVPHIRHFNSSLFIRESHSRHFNSSLFIRELHTRHCAHKSGDIQTLQ